MKTAYEIALEQMEQKGIEKPQTDKLSMEVRNEMATVRQKAEAELAQLEILHQDRVAKLEDPLGRQEEDQDYLRERQSIEDRRDAKLERLRRGTD